MTYTQYHNGTNNDLYYTETLRFINLFSFIYFFEINFKIDNTIKIKNGKKPFPKTNTQRNHDQTTLQEAKDLSQYENESSEPSLENKEFQYQIQDILLQDTPIS